MTPLRCVACSLLLFGCTNTLDEDTGGDEVAAMPSATRTLAPIPGSHNEVPINAALSQGGVVHLTAGTYVVSDTIHLASGSTLQGEPGAVIELVGHAGWPQYKPMLEGHSVSHVRITGVQIDGNAASNTTSDGVSTVCGKYFYTLIELTDSTYVEVDHSTLGDNWNDILKLHASSHVYFHNNEVRHEGHDVVYAIHSDHVYVHDNAIKIACNSGARADGTKAMYVYRNDITRDGGGYAGIEIQGASEVWACSNHIYGLLGPAIWNVSGAPLHTTGCPQ